MMWWKRILPPKVMDSTVEVDNKTNSCDDGYSIVFKQYIKRESNNNTWSHKHEKRVTQLVDKLISDGDSDKTIEGILDIINPMTTYNIGVMVAIKFNDSIYVGWSKCCKKDRFNKEFGTMVAINRALSGKFGKIPDSIKDDVERFTMRVRDYEDRKSIKCEAIENIQECNAMETVRGGM